MHLSLPATRSLWQPLLALSGNPATMGLALRGIDRAFLLTPSSEQAEAQQLNFVKEAKKAGVQHIVKLSQLAARADSPVRFLHYHAVVE